MKPVFGTPGHNLEKVAGMMKGAPSDLWVLPELFTTGYLFTSRDELQNLSEQIPEGRSTRFLTELSRTYKTAIVAGLAERDGNELYNSALYVKNGEFVGVYRKIHLFDREKLWFSPGNRSFEIYDLENIKMGIMICYDWIYPEAARSLALMGADIICHPSNLVLPYCQDAMITRCLENRIFAVTANRIGEENRGGVRLTFTGKSQITSPKGVVLRRGGYNTEEIGTVEINPMDARSKQTTASNHIFDDRNPSKYNLS
jgi:predicted amidohydrolase